MNIADLSLRDCIDNKRFLHAASRMPFTMFGTKHSKMLFTGFLHAENVNYFNISDTTKLRISNIPTKDIKGGKLIDLKNKPACGLVYFNDGLHFIYHIRCNGVYIMTSASKHKLNKYPEQVGVSLMSGFLYFDFFADTSVVYINNVFDIVNHKDHGLRSEKDIMPILNALQKGTADSVLAKQQKADYDLKWSNTRLCLQAFLFIHFAKIINTTHISEECDTRTMQEKIYKKAIAHKNVIVVNTFYDQSIKVINPFSVTGHFRNQPYGKKLTKLIYIDSFMKTGYTRKAIKEKIHYDNELTEINN